MTPITSFTVVYYCLIQFVLSLLTWNPPSGWSETLGFASLNPQFIARSNNLFKKYNYEVPETNILEPVSSGVGLAGKDFHDLLKLISLKNLKQLKRLTLLTPKVPNDQSKNAFGREKYNNLYPTELPKCSNSTDNLDLMRLSSGSAVKKVKVSVKHPLSSDPNSKFTLRLKKKNPNFRAPEEIHTGFIPFKPSEEFKLEGEIDKQFIQEANKTAFEGSYGPFSWTIEPATAEMLQSETLLSPTTIFEALVQAEKYDDSVTKSFLQSLLHKHFDQQGYSTEKINKTPILQNYKLFRNAIQKPSSNSFFSSALESSSNSQPSTVKYSPNIYGSTSMPEKYPYDEQPAYFSDYEIPNSVTTYPTSNKWDSINEWIWKAKSAFQNISTGGYKPDTFTKKLLEITIYVLAFLAFGGYIAAIVFQALLPTLRPVLANKFNKLNKNNTTAASNGLLGLLLGRNVQDTSSFLPLDYIISTLINRIDLKDLL